MKLIGSLTSPYVRKVRIVMAEKKLDYRRNRKRLVRRHADPNVQPLGKVPCLVMEDGGALFDSRVIVEYVDTLSPVARLIPQPGRDRAAVKCWEAIADGLLDACVTIVRKSSAPRRNAARNGLTASTARSTPAWTPWTRAWARTPIAWASTTAWPTSPWAARWGIWTCASLNWTGALATSQPGTPVRQAGAAPILRGYSTPGLTHPRSATRFPSGASLRTGGRNPPRSAARSPQGASLRTGKAGSARPHGHILLTFVFQTLNACPALNSMYADSANSRQANTFFSVATGRRCAMRAPSGAVSTLAQTSAISAGQ